MKLSQGINVLGSKKLSKVISKKILLANTGEQTIDGKILKKAVGASNDPIFFSNDSIGNLFNPDIRFKNDMGFSPMTSINYRNDLLMFSENNEIKKAVNIVANEMAISDIETSKYPVFPIINETLVPVDKKHVVSAMQEYLDNVFYPKLYKMYGFKDEGLIDVLKELLVTGKLAYEIIYDSLEKPTNIEGIIPIDPSTLQKIKIGPDLYYLQRPLTDNTKERILHDNQVILVEYNKYDYGYVSYTDKLRVSYNIMRSMQTSKILWFAAKSQVRMHIKLNMGDISRTDAVQKLTESKNQYINKFTFSSDGNVLFNGEPNNSGYRELFTAETTASGTPEIEEINTQGPDLTEVDSLNFWQKGFWFDTEIPYDRIDPNSSDSWGFTDVNNLRKVEVNFGKFINGWRSLFNPILIKPIIIQLTLKEAEIGVDLALLDSIKLRWIAFNQYEKLAELEILQKRIDIATSISQFGEMEDANGNMRKLFPTMWVAKNWIELTNEKLESIEAEREKENLLLGFASNGTEPEEINETEETEDQL